MPDLHVRVESAAAVPFAAEPLMGFRISVTNAVAGEAIFSVALRAQIQIEATRRRYSRQEQEHLMDLFGEPDRWGQTLRNMLWTNASVTVPAFTGAASVELQVPCTFDFNVAATKYFHGIENGEIPLSFLFSGSVFYAGPNGVPQVAPIPWNKEAQFRLPKATWGQMMDIYYPNSGWLRLRRDVLERLYEYKIRNGIPTWEAVLERILAASQEPVAR